MSDTRKFQVGDRVSVLSGRYAGKAGTVDRVSANGGLVDVWLDCGVSAGYFADNLKLIAASQQTPAARAFSVGDFVKCTTTGETGWVMNVVQSAAATFPFEVEHADGRRVFYADYELELVATPHKAPPTPQQLFPKTIKLNKADIEINIFDGWLGSPDEDERKRRKQEGRCQECGDLLPMSIWGLGECPKHPTTDPNVKQ